MSHFVSYQLSLTIVLSVILLDQAFSKISHKKKVIKVGTDTGLDLYW